MRFKVLLLLPLFFLNFSTLFSQENPVVNQWNAWFMYFGNHRLTDKWGLHTEFQWRRSDVVRYAQQLMPRIGLDYRAGENTMLTAGYAFIITYPYGEQPVATTFDEHRLWQQLFLTQQAGRFFFNHRYRLEQRWLENTAGGDRIFKNRARYRFFAAIPFTRPTMDQGAWFLALYDEVFLGFGENVSKKNILDQNRFYAALGYQFLPGANLQLGYLYQQIFKDDGIRRENNHTLQVGLTYNLDLRRETE